VEVNEVERYFVNKYVAEGILPAFDRMFRDGIDMTTRIPGWERTNDRAWRDISPWIVWPTIYTGLSPDQHGIVGLGQDTTNIRGSCIWDVLDQNGISTGVCGDLMSYPPRSHGTCKFYVPEFLANDANCIPEFVEPIQELALLGARNYSEDMTRIAGTALRLVVKSVSAGAKLSTAIRLLAQIPIEKLVGSHRTPERAMLLSYLTVDAFTSLYRRYQPQYASLHLNHVAYMQHRFWRATEPTLFKQSLAPNDRRYFPSVSARESWESKYRGWIRRSLTYTDRVLQDLLRLAGNDVVIIVAGGLGQCPMDPVDEIHNPIVRLVDPLHLFQLAGIKNFTAAHQMNPDLTLTFEDEVWAQDGQDRLAGFRIQESEPMFKTCRRGHQIFVDLVLPPDWLASSNSMIRHKEIENLSVPCDRHISLNSAMEQSTAHHIDAGLLLAYSPARNLRRLTEVVDVSAIAATILSLFGIQPQPWMDPSTKIAFEIE
tara:strand:+ start:494 stop:1948 length:1455 start_codon:yes stop_codon:yes gene_type:complete